jgi:outer membrane protein OmpA-like peptidoglycan-associated protein
MRKFLLWLLGLLLVGILVYLCFGQKADEIKREILYNVNTTFSSNDIKWAKADVKGEGLSLTRIITLDGIAPSQQLKTKAGLLASSVAGVAYVQNNLKIKHSSKEQESTIEDSKIDIIQPVIEDVVVVVPKSLPKIKVVEVKKPIQKVIQNTHKKGDNKKLALSCQKEFKKTTSKDRVLFEYGKAGIKSTSYKLLDDIVNIAKKCPDAFISIEGHTDWDGTKKANIILSTNRANSVKEYFIKKGISSKRLTTIGHGESKPIGNNRTVEGQKKNRRIEFIVKGVK